MRYFNFVKLWFLLSFFCRLRSHLAFISHEVSSRLKSLPHISSEFWLYHHPTKNSKSQQKFESYLFMLKDDYLSNLVSSPERYAEALNLTVEKVAERKQQYLLASQELHQKILHITENNKQSKSSNYQIKNNTMSNGGNEKHRLICQHRLQYLQHPFVCHSCWSYLPVCVCKHEAVSNQEHQRRLISSLPSRLEVIVWIHHKEWGLTSNTGGLLKLALGDSKCKLFMKGLPDHDNQLQQLYINKHIIQETLLVVLWPTNDRQQAKKNWKHRAKSNSAESYGKNDNRFESAMTNESFTRPTITLDEIRAELNSSSGRRVILMAVDGTWRNARRMVVRLPPIIPNLSLSPKNMTETYFLDGDTRPSSMSLLAPLRTRGQSQRKDGGESLVCTAEAVTFVLSELGMDRTCKESILDLARTKVDLIRRYRGHESKVP